MEFLEVLLAHLVVTGDERAQQHLSTASGCMTTMKREGGRLDQKDMSADYRY